MSTALHKTLDSEKEPQPPPRASRPLGMLFSATWIARVTITITIVITATSVTATTPSVSPPSPPPASLYHQCHGHHPISVTTIPTLTVTNSYDHVITITVIATVTGTTRSCT
ncbi:hypothetical protein TREES_T100014245 [Tupaia chinensis]|uniref:Uncharacterized protein n=1 Tax=Tupaia chinensis TaxID=246437 RepID=L9JEX8_TUPCH|nr:hypothetical protein TREES_T100014245 [Tupaia chinensis]